MEKESAVYWLEQTLISLGCFFGLLRMTVRRDARECETRWFPDGRITTAVCRRQRFGKNSPDKDADMQTAGISIR